MVAQRGVVVVVEAFDGRILDGSVHPCALAAIRENSPPDCFLVLMAPRMPDLGQPVLDAVFFATHIVKHLGASGVRAMIARHGALAVYFAERLSAEPGIEIVNDVVSNKVALACRDDELTAIVLDRMQTNGSVYPGRRVWRAEVGGNWVGMPLDGVAR